MDRVLVVGCTGMLGAMEAEVLLREPGVEPVLLCRQPVRWRTRSSRAVPVEAYDVEADADGAGLDALLARYRPAFIFNASGIIKPYCKDGDYAGRRRAVAVNALFPYRLQEAAGRHGARVLQIATDCVYDGVSGGYDERSPHNAVDVYGKTKSLGEVVAPNVLNIRCSIIGPEKHNRVSLLEWFLSHPDGVSVNGYDHHVWNGVTTLQFARLCRDIIRGEPGLDFDALAVRGRVLHYVPNTTVTKYELCRMVAAVYGRKLHVARVMDEGPAVKRDLAVLDPVLTRGRMPAPMREAVEELRRYTEEIGFTA